MRDRSAPSVGGCGIVFIVRNEESIRNVSWEVVSFVFVQQLNDVAQYLRSFRGDEFGILCIECECDVPEDQECE